MDSSTVHPKIIKKDLAAIFLQPSHIMYYYQLLKQSWRGPRPIVKDPQTALQAYAKTCVERAFGTTQAPKLMYPVHAYEIVASNQPISLYRTYDGENASEFGSWWSDPELLHEIVNASASRDKDGKLRQEQVLTFMLSSAFVHPTWNTGKNVARMRLANGARAAVIVGAGCWEAMKTASDSDRSVSTPVEVMDRLRMVPIPGPKQIFVTLFDKGWISPVPRSSHSWPFS